MDHFSSTDTQLTRSRFHHAATGTTRPRIAISACLTGERVRYDGDHCHSPAMEWLAGMVEWLPVCPEVGAGLSVPRPPVRLVRLHADAEPHALGRDDPALDVTTALADFARVSAARLADQRACGYLLKSRSPSCGLRSTPLFDADGTQLATTAGIQAQHCRDTLPWLACCEETDLVDRMAAQAFALRCLLTFDCLYAGHAALPDLHRHYRFLHEHFPPAVAAALEQFAAAGQPGVWVGELQHHCERMPAAQLLALFTS